MAPPAKPSKKRDVRLTDIGLMQPRPARRSGSASGRVAQRPVDPYGDDEAGFSWFRDRAVVAHDAGAVQRAIDSGRAGGSRNFLGVEPLFAARGELADHGGPAEARRRLGSVVAPTFQRDASAQLSVGPPAFVAEAVALGERSAAPLLAALPQRALPERGRGVTAYRVGSVTAEASVRPSGGAVDDADVEIQAVEAAVVDIAGRVDIDRGELARAAPLLDRTLALELGAELAAAAERQVLAGTGSQGELLGLLSVDGPSVEYTDASPDAAGVWQALLRAIAAVADAHGQMPDLAVVSPRRYAQLAGSPDLAGMRLPEPVRFVVTPGMPTTLGDGGNEDAIVVAAAAEVPVFVSPVELRVHTDVPSKPAAVRTSAWRFFAFPSDRRPSAVGKVSGSGLTDPFAV